MTGFMTFGACLLAVFGSAMLAGGASFFAEAEARDIRGDKNAARVIMVAGFIFVLAGVVVAYLAGASL